MDQPTTTAATIVYALIPPRTTQPGLLPPSPLPLVDLHALPHDGSMHYDIARVDSSGRFSMRSLLRALDWHAGDRIAMAVLPEMILFHRSDDGIYQVSQQSNLAIPAAARTRHSIKAGDQVLLAGATTRGLLVIQPLAVLDKMMTTYHGRPGEVTST